MMELLVEAGADVDTRDPLAGIGAVAYCVMGHVPAEDRSVMLATLERLGADPTLETLEGKTPQDLLNEYDAGCDDIREYVHRFVAKRLFVPKAGGGAEGELRCV